VPHAIFSVAFRKKKMLDEAIAQYQKAIALQPQFIPAQINLAWMLATWPESSVRNGAEAITLMKKASELHSDKDSKIFRTLAAAYAEAGKFPDAVLTAKKALAMAESQSVTVLVNELHAEIQLYQANSPCRSTD
jgi:tetratricopeptide (TPR) repeat protein